MARSRLTQGVLLADVFHYPHKTVADALFISVLAHFYAGPVALFVLTFLIQQLPALKYSEEKQEETELWNYNGMETEAVFCNFMITGNGIKVVSMSSGFQQMFATKCVKQKMHSIQLVLAYKIINYVQCFDLVLELKQGHVL